MCCTEGNALGSLEAEEVLQREQQVFQCAEQILAQGILLCYTPPASAGWNVCNFPKLAGHAWGGEGCSEAGLLEDLLSDSGDGSNAIRQKSCKTVAKGTHTSATSTKRPQHNHVHRTSCYKVVSAAAVVAQQHQQQDKCRHEATRATSSSLSSTLEPLSPLQPPDWSSD